MIHSKSYLVPEAELLVIQPDGLLLASPGDVSENGTEIGTVVDSGWEDWGNN